MAIDDGLDTLSDAELFALAGQSGIDSSLFATPTVPPAFDTSAIAISPEVQAMVDQIFQAQRELGTQELNQNAVEQAGARGLNMTDTPIFQPYTRANALFESQLRADQAKALLGISENRFAQREAGGLNRAGMLEASRKFQAEQARLWSGQAGNFLSGLASSTGGTAVTGSNAFNPQQLLAGSNAITTGLGGLFGSS